MVTFFKRLRERRLVQIVVSYVGAGWALLQVVDQLTDRGIVGNVVYQVSLTWYLIGIPAAFMVGWFHGERGRQRAPMIELFALVLLALAATGFSASTVSQHRNALKVAEALENPLEVRRMAVRYFEDRSPGGGYDYLAEGLTEALIAELQRVPGLSVISANGMAGFRDAAIPSDSVGRALGAGTVVEGTISARNDRVSVDLQLLEGESGAVFGRVHVEESFTDVEELRTKIAEQTARLLRNEVGIEARLQQRRARTEAKGAWIMLQRAENVRKDAESRIREGDMPAALALFKTVEERLAQAEAADRDWVEPIVARAAVTYRQARLAQGDPEQAVMLIGQTVAHAERALGIEPTNARALEMRGTANYYYWLLRTAPDAETQDRLLASARADLEAAVQYDPTLASAHATLSHLYYQDDIAAAMLAAATAYRQDAYLEAADVVLWRLFNGSFELGIFNKAREWCTEGQRRFPEHYRFASCALRMMITPGTEPNPAEAWALLARQDSLLPERFATFERVRGELLVGGVLARAGMADSARAVVNRAAARIDEQLDPTQELVVVEALVRVLTKEPDRAIALLTRYGASHPEVFESNRGEISWYWRDLQTEPRFRRLMGLD